MDVLLSDKAFIGIILSAIEVYKNECLGALLGYNLRNRIVVEYGIPYQTAKRKPTETEPNWNRAERLKEVLPKIIHIKHVGYFHSHTQRGEQKANTQPSDKDIKSMVPSQIEIIVAVNDSRRKVQWYSSENELYGSIGKYHIGIACYYKNTKGENKQYPILCPYVLGFDLTL